MGSEFLLLKRFLLGWLLLRLFLAATGFCTAARIILEKYGRWEWNYDSFPSSLTELFTSPEVPARLAVGKFECQVVASNFDMPLRPRPGTTHCKQYRPSSRSLTRPICFLRSEEHTSELQAY